MGVRWELKSGMTNKRIQISRRSFLRTISATAVATGVPLWYVERSLAQAQPAAPASPGDRRNIALIGCGGMGTSNLQEASRMFNVVAVCDADSGHLDGAARRFTGNGNTVKKYSDFRELLKNDDVHAIINATPDHWHTLINIAAARAKRTFTARNRSRSALRKAAASSGRCGTTKSFSRPAASSGVTAGSGWLASWFAMDASGKSRK